jgi:acetylornithine deacetylase
VTDAELLALHREIVAIPSVSRDEGALSAFLAAWLGARGVVAERVGKSLFAVSGERAKGRASAESVGLTVCLCSHLDTVPPTAAWTRPPHEVTVEGGRVYGLGSNDAKASVAAMIAAYLRTRDRADGTRVLLALTAEEEVGGTGAEALVPELARRGLTPDAVIVGEPTGLDIAIAQKGLLVLELVARGQSCHAAHGRALAATNAIHALARDLVALSSVSPGPAHPDLGPVTVEPTVIQGGAARNMVPDEASCVLDVRVNPEPNNAEVLAVLRAAIEGELRVLSDRLHPCAIDPGHPLVQAALRARPQAKLFGSRGLSDLVFFRGIPGIKVGPGRTERSHTPDEYVLESEIVEGARFYEQAVMECAAGQGVTR